MDIDKLNEVARKAASSAEQLQRIVDSSATAKIKELLEQSPVARIQRALDNSAVARLQKHLDYSSLTAFQKQAEAAAARIRAFDSAAAQAVERSRAAFDHSIAVQAIANLELSVAATGAQKYLEEQAAFFDRIKVGSLILFDEAHVTSPRPARLTIKTSIPKIRVSVQAKQEYVPAPTVEPKIELPPAHRLASVFQYLLTKGAYKRTVEPHLVDLYDEYSELIQKGEENRATWVVVRGHFLIIWSQLKRPMIALAGWLTTPKG